MVYLKYLLQSQLAEPQKFLSQFETANIVQSENLNRRAPGRGQALKVCVPEYKMVSPLVASRMKKDLHSARQRVDPGQIGAFVKITAMTCQRKIIGFIETAMLPGNDVLNVMRKFAAPLVESTILAAFTSPVTDESPGSRIHR